MDNMEKEILKEEKTVACNKQQPMCYFAKKIREELPKKMMETLNRRYD